MATKKKQPHGKQWRISPMQQSGMFVNSGHSIKEVNVSDMATRVAGVALASTKYVTGIEIYM